MSNEEGVKIFKEPTEEQKRLYYYKNMEDQINEFIKSQSYIYFNYETKDMKLSGDGKTCILSYKIGGKKL